MIRLKKDFIAVAVVAFAMVALSSCGTKRVAADGLASANATVPTKGGTKQTAASGSQQSHNDGTAQIEQMNFLRKVADNAVYAKNIVSKIKCTINTGSNDISVGGSLHMKKDAVIRIQITPFGLMEAGRLEFTPDYVLLVDRIHKEYVKATYSDVDFLHNNGLDFYALQAIFWNQLFVPGTQKMADSSLKSFSAALTGAATTDVSLTRGKMKYVWNTNSTSALINSLHATYTGTGAAANTSVNCRYADFRAVGAKQFPTDITLTMNAKAVRNSSKMMLRLQLNGISSEDGWEEKTTVSSKYKQVSVQDLLGKLGSL